MKTELLQLLERLRARAWPSPETWHPISLKFVYAFRLRSTEAGRMILLLVGVFGLYTATIGISDHAQEQLGDVVYVELPEEGAEFAEGAEAATVESVKAASEIYAPAAGEVVEVNGALNDDPSLVNSDPLGDGWFFKLQPTDVGELEGLLSAEEYQQHCEEE